MDRQSSILRRSSPVARATWGVAAVCLVGLWSVVAVSGWVLVENATRQARATAQNTAALAAAYVKQSLDAGSLVLHGMQAMLAEKGVHDEASYRAFLDGPAVTQALRDRIANMKEIDKAAFIAPTGEILNFSIVHPPPPINVADRDYFLEQMGGAPPDRSLSATVADRSSGKWTFFLAQRVAPGLARAALLALDRSDGGGRPIGLAIVGLRAGLLSDFFAQNRLGESGVVLLLRDDDVLLAGAGVPPAAYGRKFSLDAAVLRAPGSAARPAPDIVAAEPVAGFPARIVVLAGPVEATAILREALPAGLAIGLLVSLALLFMAWRTLRAVAARRSA